MSRNTAKGIRFTSTTRLIYFLWVILAKFPSDFGLLAINFAEGQVYSLTYQARLLGDLVMPVFLNAGPHE